jgi:rare lipoprotein A (peptidoglycan hydrolase)
VVFRERGEASVYGDELQGRRTASGARFDQREPMAAHPELPLGSQATVTNPETGRKVEVEIVDRGPHVEGRVLDLSEGAVRRLGVAREIREEGDAEVLIEATSGPTETFGTHGGPPQTQQEQRLGGQEIGIIRTGQSTRDQVEEAIDTPGDERKVE